MPYDYKRLVLNVATKKSFCVPAHIIEDAVKWLEKRVKPNDLPQEGVIQSLGQGMWGVVCALNSDLVIKVMNDSSSGKIIYDKLKKTEEGKKLLPNYVKLHYTSEDNFPINGSDESSWSIQIMERLRKLTMAEKDLFENVQWLNSSYLCKDYERKLSSFPKEQVEHYKSIIIPADNMFHDVKPDNAGAKADGTLVLFDARL